ncbi:zinc-binding dehydrogenase, partial [candidate division KSB1 bacterium]
PVAVIGDGKLGQLIARAAQARDYIPHLFGKNESKLRLAAQQGIRTCSSTTVPERRYRTVIECSGKQSGLQKALEIIEPKGTVIMKSTFAGKSEINFADVVINETSLIGSRCGRFESAVEMLEKKAIDVESLISAEFTLDQGIEAFQYAEKPGVLKVLLRIGPE